SSDLRPIRGAASVLLILGIAVALAHLSVDVAAYARVTPLTSGLLWTIPIAIGIAAVVLSFRPLPYQESTRRALALHWPRAAPWWRSSRPHSSRVSAPPIPWRCRRLR